MNDFLEPKIIQAVKAMLTGKVNDLLGKTEHQIPMLEFTDYQGVSALTPVIRLISCERTEKERIIRQDAYSLSITFSLPDTLEGELYCYVYAGAVCRAVWDDPTLAGVVDRAVVTGKKFIKPEKPHNGQPWELILSLRLTITCSLLPVT